MVDKGTYEKGFTCNPSNCEYECYKSYDESVRKNLVDKLFEEINSFYLICFSLADNINSLFFKSHVVFLKIYILVYKLLKSHLAFLRHCLFYHPLYSCFCFVLFCFLFYLFILLSMVPVFLSDSIYFLNL